MNTNMYPNTINIVKKENIYYLILMEDNGASVTARLSLYLLEELVEKFEKVK